MSGSIFGRIYGSDDIKGSMKALYYFVVFFSLGMVGLYLSIEDIYTTKLGWDVLPTGDVSSLTAWVIAIGLYMFSAAAFYKWATSSEWVWFYLWVGALSIDSLADMAFRITASDPLGETWIIVVASILQSFVVFTIASDFALGIGFIESLELLPAARTQFFKLLRGFVAGEQPEQTPTRNSDAYRQDERRRN